MNTEVREFLPYADYVPYVLWPVLVWPVIVVLGVSVLLFTTPKRWREWDER